MELLNVQKVVGLDRLHKVKLNALRQGSGMCQAQVLVSLACHIHNNLITYPWSQAWRAGSALNLNSAQLKTRWASLKGAQMLANAASFPRKSTLERIGKVTPSTYVHGAPFKPPPPTALNAGYICKLVTRMKKNAGQTATFSKPAESTS
jgi:hypothetical protein